MQHFLRCSFAVLIFSCVIATPALADLRKEQVAVLANKRSAEGLALAKYYLQARGLSPDQLIILDLPLESDSVERELYEAKIVEPIRQILIERKLSGKVRVLVSTFGIPLRVLAPEAKGEEKQTLLDALNFRKQAHEQLEKIAATVEPLAGIEKEADTTEKKEEENDQTLLNRIRVAIAKAAERKVEESEKKNFRLKLTESLSQFGGLAAVSEAIKIPDGAKNEQAQEALQKLKQDVQSAQKILGALDEARTPENRKRAYLLTARVFGAAGILGRASAQIKLLEYHDADASVDSELGFLWFNREHYLLSERVPNPYAHFHLIDGKPGLSALPLMLVSRIDGSTAAKARQLIDFALQTEKSGLSGNAYIDARGMPKAETSYGAYDENLRQLGKLLDNETSFDVTVNNRDERFTEAKDVALYCGWYRLRHYEDVFTFKPGAIGYHIASEEAVSLHSPEETGWCKNAIDHGITVTLGAVGEPYLDSFPRPVEFFGLLLSGRYSLIEAYTLTNPYVSWRMTLLGDPFYKPFHEELVSSEELSDQDEHAKTLNPYPLSPLEQSYEDPAEIHKKLTTRHEQLLKELDSFYTALMQRLSEKNKK